MFIPVFVYLKQRFWSNAPANKKPYDFRLSSADSERQIHHSSFFTYLLPVTPKIVLVISVEDGTDDPAQNFEHQDEDDESYYVVHNIDV